ncbi:MAG: HAD family hydrolase [Candidatus Liptonbacteria bacterium]|nr:HAD family hydrolase [Candidatus Liptonbacteria bacterium]
MKKRAVFLDRDGTLVKDSGYFHDAERVEFLPGVIEGLRRLQSAGFLLIVVSNQSGVGRGYFPECDTIAVNEKITELLKKEGVRIAKFYYCPHAPDAGCACRKPKPLLVARAAKEFGVAITSSFFIGNHATDVETGRAAGLTAMFLGSAAEAASAGADAHAPDMRAAAEEILKTGSRRGGRFAVR